jgi:mannose/fructose/N-acetylgalactosamine-specific phosphotransferase system component IIB
MGKWNISSATCKKSQLLISKKWVEENMKSMNEKYNNDLNRKIFYDEIPLETIQLLEKIKELEYELERVKIQHCNDVEQERCENQFLQLQLENNIQFSKLKEEKYLLQIQMLQNK